MSQQNVEVVRRAFESWDGDPQAQLQYLAPDVEWTIRADLPEAGTYRGHDGFLQILAQFQEGLEDIGFKPLEYIDAGDHVVVPLEWWGRGRESGAVVAERQGETWVFTVRHGKIATVTEFRGKAEALESVGRNS